MASSVEEGVLKNTPVEELSTTADRYCFVCNVQVRKHSDLDRVEKFFLGFSLVSLIIAVAMTIERISSVETSSTDFIFGILLLINLFFVLYYVVYGIFMERPFEILFSFCTLLVVMIYCIVDYSTNIDGRTKLKIIRLCIVCILGFFDILIGISVMKNLFRSPRNLMIRLVGADIEMQKICKVYQFFVAFLGFQLQIMIMLVVLICFDKPKILGVSEKIILGIGVPSNFILTLLARIGARREIKWISYLFLAFCLVPAAYIIYLFDRFGKLIGEETRKGSPNKGNKILYGGILVAGSIGLVVHLVLMALTYKVIKNYDKGFKLKQDSPRSCTDMETSIRIMTLTGVM